MVVLLNKDGLFLQQTIDLDLVLEVFALVLAGLLLVLDCTFPPSDQLFGRLLPVCLMFFKFFGGFHLIERVELYLAL
jgi:hypothetical protein